MPEELSDVVAGIRGGYLGYCIHTINASTASAIYQEKRNG
jgi:hypothetical protein